MKYGESLGAITCILKVFQSGLRLYTCISDLSDNLNISNGLICDWVALRVLCQILQSSQWNFYELQLYFKY